MNFQVLWMQQAIQSLAQVYLSARDDGEAQAVTAAMAEIDHMLQLTDHCAKKVKWSRCSTRLGRSRIAPDEVSVASDRLPHGTPRATVRGP
ncbi:MAG TPA: hypothetical protein VM533_13635, partial [Fimbriiglobus sp.]|nr:hypothetical protein [Fimbriiglobus sp.]